jgi:hypothetical protein
MATNKEEQNKVGRRRLRRRLFASWQEKPGKRGAPSNYDIGYRFCPLGFWDDFTMQFDNAQ